MATTGYTKIIYSGNGVNILTTHAQVIEGLFLQVKQTITGSNMTVPKKATYGRGGEVMTELSLTRLGGQDESVGRWMVAALCAGGWEVFQVDAMGTAANYAYYLRLA